MSTSYPPSWRQEHEPVLFPSARMVRGVRLRWDDTHPPRRVQGFYKKTELELLIQRRSARRALGDATIDGKIVERQSDPWHPACRRGLRAGPQGVARDGHWRGKTRTVIALC